MLDKKSVQIINDLINEEEISLVKLMSKTSFSKKQILYSLEHINAFLVDNGKTELLLVRETVILSLDNKLFLIHCFQDNRFFEDYLLDSKERVKYLFFLLFNKASSYVSMSDFLMSLKVSKSTIIADKKKLEELLKQYHITIVHDRNVGYYLAGDISQMRHLAISYISKDISSPLGTFFYDYFFFNEKLDYLAQIQSLIKYHALERYGFSFTDKQLTELIYVLALFYHQLTIRDDNIKRDFCYLKASKEYQMLADVLQNVFAESSDSTIIFLAMWLLTLTTAQIDEETFDRDEILNLARKVIHQFERLSGIEFYNLKEVEKNLYSHFRAVHYRMIFKHPLTDQMSMRIKTQYGHVFDIVALALKEIEDCYSFPIPDEEIAYLTIYFVLAIKDYSFKKTGKKVAAVICQHGIGSSALVFQQLQLLFPDFQFLGPYDKNHLLLESSPIDMIFSTETNLDLYSLSPEVFIVNPIMTAEERYSLLRKVYRKFGFGNIKLPRVTDLMAIIDKNSDVKNTYQLQRELYTYLLSPTTGKAISEASPKKPNLSDLLTVDFIQTDVIISSYEEALVKASEPLLKYEIIDVDYVEQLIADYRQGKLLQLTPLFCMPHAKPTDTIQLGMSLLVLKKPYILSADVAVKYILVLSAPKSDLHLLAMNQLLQVLGQDDFYSHLDAGSPDDIYQYLLNYHY